MLFGTAEAVPLQERKAGSSPPFAESATGFGMTILRQKPQIFWETKCCATEPKPSCRRDGRPDKNIE